MPNRKKMTSKIEVIRICEFCDNEFIAKTTVTRFCCHKCAQKAYKRRQKAKKISKTEQAVKVQKDILQGNPILETVQKKDFLSIKETALLIGLSERTIHRLIKAEKLKVTKIGRRTIIHKTAIDKLFNL